MPLLWLNLDNLYFRKIHFAKVIRKHDSKQHDFKLSIITLYYFVISKITVM